jgi:hypothetical protein
MGFNSALKGLISIPVLSTHVRLGLPYLHLSGFPAEILYAPLVVPMRAACPHLTILDFVPLIIFGE